VALPVNGSTHLIPAYYSFYRPRKDERLSWPSWLTCSGWFTHISGHPSAAGRAQDRESSPARDRRSTTVPRHQQIITSPMRSGTFLLGPNRPTLCMFDCPFSQKKNRVVDFTARCRHLFTNLFTMGLTDIGYVHSKTTLTCGKPRPLVRQV